MNNGKGPFTVKEVAALTRFEPSTVRRWIGAGKVNAVKIGHQFRIPAEEIRRLGFSVPGS